MAGFAEGDSSFLIRLSKPNDNRNSKGKVYNHVSTTFELCQTRIDLELFEKY